MSTSEAAADERLERFLEEYGPTLARIVASLCPREGAIDRAEVEQEVRVRLWRALRGETNLERPASYLYRVAATATIDAARRLRARREEQMEGSASAEGPSHVLTLADDRPGPEELARSAELGDRLARALDTLAEDRRTAVKLHLQGFTSGEIAELLGWTEARARNLASRGMKDLRSRLQQGESRS
jgi:RNA polymerase sigma-70 factor (ECF subfamily)